MDAISLLPGFYAVNLTEAIATLAFYAVVAAVGFGSGRLARGKFNS